ncbi:type II toxin-antitoxin system RelE/ParE family toxin [Bradyrhizobium sp. STM 3557]|uniref:type II toxin-antitoxin system RelE/ParE family toxin n=1 Tax=Bradyrhizobium sp. STM 3557 TaxID=578920 RepID=UPI0038906FB8
MAKQKWRVRLGAVAELDFANILKWTAENFGARQARVYQDTLVRAIGELASAIDVAGSKIRDDISPGRRTLHVARHGRRGRHLLLYRSDKRGSSKSAVSFTTGWTSSVICRRLWTVMKNE